MDTAEFDYDLPPGRIAQHPLAERDSSRLLVDRGAGIPPEHRQVCDLDRLLEPGDLLVVNTTRVLPARLALHKPTGGAAEVLLLEPRAGRQWEALVRPGRRLAPGTVLTADGGVLTVVVGDDLGDGIRLVEVVPAAGIELIDALERVGEVPLPPYITAGLDDPERYQTVYAREPASAAAPTAGLHLTPALLERCRARGVDIATVELVVGIGTFRPISTEKVERHAMHAERYRVPEETMVKAGQARAVVAVGTTVVRALESAAATGRLEGRTELFIHGDHPFRVVDRLLTNFHQPRSSLLVMIDAFVGPRWRQLYEVALMNDYRFLSFGDAMLLTRQPERAVA
jgi:S-adenosylmethionine:tRNA ribosyltransferase-isomerase